MELTREELLQKIWHYTSTEFYDEFHDALKDASYEELEEILQYINEHLILHTNTKEELMNVKKLIKDGRKICISKTNIKFLDENENNLLISKIRKSKPSDIVYIDASVEEKLASLVLSDDNTKEKDNSCLFVGSDLFFSKNVPLMDLIIRFGDLSSYGETRVVIFDNIYKLDQEDDDKEIIVGAIVDQHSEKIGTLITPIAVMKGVDFIISYNNKYGYINMPYMVRECFINDEEAADMITRNISPTLIAWYGIQLALLHPDLKEVFSSGKMTATHNSSTKRGRKKVKYVKQHIITVEGIEAKMRAAEERAGITRHTYAWYVIGHWRTYKNGKKVFVKGYWKGPNRDQKETPEEIREREIVIPSDIDQ